MFVCKKHNDLIFQGVKILQTHYVGIHLLLSTIASLMLLDKKTMIIFPFCLNALILNSFHLRIKRSLNIVGSDTVNILLGKVQVQPIMPPFLWIETSELQFLEFV